MKILITGHKGFCGRHFVSKLARHRIVGVDVKDGRDCRDFFRTNTDRFDLVIHLAAIIGGRETIEGDPIAVATDLSIDAEMFNWAVRTKQKKVIYFSSSAAYPVSLQAKPYKLKESDIDIHSVRSPDFTYGWTKLSGEILADYARGYGIKTYVFRPFSGYGPDQDLTYPFPSFIQRVKRRENPFVIWGDGRQVRDFIHMDDIVEATLLAVKLDIQEPVNLGWGRPTSFRELATLMLSVAGIRNKPRFKFLANKPTGVMYRVSDNRTMLSFYQPKITLEEGIARALNNLRGTTDAVVL